MNQPVLLLALVFGAIIAVGCVLVFLQDVVERALQQRAERRAEWRLSPPTSGPRPPLPSAPRMHARTLRSGQVRAASPRPSPLRDVGARALNSSGPPSVPPSSALPKLLAPERPAWLDSALRDAGPPRRTRGPWRR
ncbi:MAG: hypothetical protein R6W77_12340 [Trueperaceae bacterium]